jgi:hypothetical protein
MPRFVMIVEWAGERDLAPMLERAREAMVFGGSRESVLELQRPGFAAVVLSHQSRVPAIESAGHIVLAGGHGLPDEDDAAFIEAAAVASRTPGAALPPLRRRPLGRRSLVRWDPSLREVLVVTEPNGLAPLYLYGWSGGVVLATEVKGIWAAAPEPLRVDADALLDLYTVGECVGARTPFREVSAAPPGVVMSLRPERVTQREWYAPRFSEHVGGDGERGGRAMNEALLATLAAERPRSGRVTVALSGGMDSRYVLAGARRLWEHIETVTFGPVGSTDVARARAVAARCRVPNRYVPWDGSDLPGWAPYAVWRSDGLLSCLHMHGMDALITHSSATGLVLNGMGGDILTGVFLRPTYLLATGGTDETVRTILARRRFHDRRPEEVFKPELLREVRRPTAEALAEVMSRTPCRRLGNTLLNYWVRQHAARFTVVGLDLEAPFLDYATPLADPYFVEAVAGLSLEERFLGRAYRRALGWLGPETMSIACERYGLAPHWPWPVLALRGAARRLGLVRRARLPASYTQGFRGPVLPWVREILLDRETIADGFFLPGYLRSVVEGHATGHGDHAAELGMALSVELWRRLFVTGRRELARPPIPLPEPGTPLRSFREVPSRALGDGSAGGGRS